jgi:Tfp pilus assembly protein PilN
MLIFNANLGIDFRRNHLILTLLQRSFGKIRLLDYRIYPLWAEEQKGIREGQWISLISTFLAKHQINKNQVCVSIPREKVVVRFLRLPASTKENLRKVLEYEAPKYTPFEKESIYLDFQILGEDKEWLELIAVFARQSDVTPYLDLLKKMGLQPIAVQIPAVGALNLFAYHQGEKKYENAVLLDLSAPFFEMNLLQKAKWKESIQRSLPDYGRADRILDTFKRAGVAEETLPRSTFFVYGLDMAEKMFPDLAEREDVKEVCPPPLDRLGMAEDESRPDYIYSSIGLPLKGLAKTEIQLNLLPQEMRRKVREFGKPVFNALVVLAILLSLSWGVGVFMRYPKELRDLRAAVKNQKPEVEAVEKVRKQRIQLEREITEFTRIASGEIPKVEILRELTQLLPDTVWIWNFKYSGKEVEISGFADSASELISLLDKSPLFEKVEFLAPVTKQLDRRIGGDKEKERFKIKLRLEGRSGA